MSKLHIQLELAHQKQTAHIFETFPVRIGRSKFNDLKIDHESIPRELCIAWLETDGQTVRVEERPGLKNPLLCGKTRVEGGISGKNLHLRAGAAAIGFSADGFMEKSTVPKRSFGVAAASALCLIFVIAAVGRTGPKTQSGADLFSVLPKSPNCHEPSVQCADRVSCEERARLLYERGQEILSRRGATLTDLSRAVSNLKDSLSLTVSVAPVDTAEATQLPAHAEERLMNAYQQEVMRLRAAVKEQNRAAVKTSAALIKDAIGICDPRATRMLEQLIEANLESVEAK